MLVDASLLVYASLEDFPEHEAARDWLDCRSVWIPAPAERHTEILGNLLVGSRATGNLVPDAHLAALAIEHGLTLHSSDRDFAAFTGLSWLDPLA